MRKGSYRGKGLTDATSNDVCVGPKTPDSKMVLLVRRTLPERERILCSLCQEESLFFSFTHASPPFPLETSGSFFKFNSFLLIYLFIYFFKFNFYYLFICSFPTNPLQRCSQCILQTQPAGQLNIECIIVSISGWGIQNYVLVYSSLH